jgi:hypothetical protein
VPFQSCDFLSRLGLLVVGFGNRGGLLMKVLSASEAVWPALLRTYSCLFRAFKLESFLKMASVALLSEGFLVSIRFWTPHTFPIDVDFDAVDAFLLRREFLPVTILAVLAVLVVAIYCAYLVTRLRFGFVHCLIHQSGEVRAASIRYAVEAERFFTASLLVWMSLVVLAVAAMAIFVIAGYAVVSTPGPDGKLDRGNFFFVFFPCLGILVALVLAAWIAQVILNDFILPHMAIEGMSFRQAWKVVRARMAANRETFLSFFILRMAMPLIASVILGGVAWVLGFAVFGILGLSADGFNAMFFDVTGWRETLRICIESFFVALGLVAGWVIAAVLGGPLGVFMRCYALYFYGGHLKVLGNLLEPPAVQSEALPAERVAEIR